MPALVDPPVILHADPVPEASPGEWFAVGVRLKRPEGVPDAVSIRNLDCTEREIQLDASLLQSNVEVRPGEVYHFTILLKVPRVREVNLSAVYLQVASPSGLNELFNLPDQAVSVRPALGRDVAVVAEPLCSYGDVTKLQLTFRHEGAAVYENLRIHVGPRDAVLAGKQPLRRPLFRPGDEEVAAVAASADLQLEMEAVAGGMPVKCRKTIPVRKVVPHSAEPFRFLEPRRLSSDHVLIRDLQDQGRPVPPRRSAFPLVGGRAYQVVIQPQTPGVTEVVMNDVPGSLHVRPYGWDDETEGWKFVVEVSHAELFSKPERLNYRVRTAEESLTGDVHLTLWPPWLRPWTFALAVGLAASVQGLAVLARWLFEPGKDIGDALAHFALGRDYPVLFIFSIPLIWSCVWAVDRVRDRLRG
jgi:hypothetical protein